MISEAEYEVLTMLLQNPEIDEGKYFPVIQSLLREKLIVYNTSYNVPPGADYNGYFVTPKGHRAYEEYTHFLENEEREDETLKLAKEAIRKSRNANIISIVAIIFSTIFSVLAFAFSVWTHFNN